MREVFNPDKVVNYFVWFSFVVLYMSASTILLYNVPTFPTFLLFVFLVEFVLIEKMVSVIRRLNSIEVKMEKDRIVVRTDVDLMDIESV